MKRKGFIKTGKRKTTITRKKVREAVREVKNKMIIKKLSAKVETYKIESYSIEEI